MSPPFPYAETRRAGRFRYEIVIRTDDVGEYSTGHAYGRRRAAHKAKKALHAHLRAIRPPEVVDRISTVGP